LNDILATITTDSESGQVKDISLHQNPFRFKCKRCATFCCRLGGPLLTEKDIQRIKEAGHDEEDFLDPLEPVACRFKDNLRKPVGSLKNKEDGSCVFLRFSVDRNQYDCSIYDFRPALCRLYPFSFDREASNIIVLKIIPCCRGLYDPDGRPVDEGFVTCQILEPLLEAMDSFENST
jgi:Fe-S-cluster containining protein